ncbi:phage major capsid protein [Bifidobacterium magnum]|uniref:Phage major capsid protein n=1 Tax=Bifidobacterium magnum TaxID=1692 RepID=A0A087BB57_9BIFI|nr:phage major capsid protein [Bifidobacterium magnum]KFI68257.1 Phage major capsid protein [Bifidobacterium magnum]
MSGISTTQTGAAGSQTVEYHPNDLIPTALINTQTTFGAVIVGDAPAMNIPYVDTPPASQVVAEGEEIPDGGATMNTLVAHTRKIANIQAFSNEIANMGNNVQEQIVDAMARSLTDKADAFFLQNNPTNDPNAPTGLFNTKGTVTADPIDTNLDPIVSAMAKVTINGGKPSSIILSPATWAKLLQLKYTDGRPMIDPTAANSANPVLYGLPVVLNNQAPANKILINSISEVMSAYGTVVCSSTEDRYFDYDSMAIRQTFRIGWGVIHPNRLAIITLKEAQA